MPPEPDAPAVEDQSPVAQTAEPMNQAAAPTDQAPAAPNSTLPAWQDVRDQWMAQFPALSEERVRGTYEGIAHVADWRARVANSEETTGSWLYRRVLPVASAQLNLRNAGYVDTARQRLASGIGTAEDAEVMAVQDRLAESDQNASQGTKIAGALAGIPAVLGEAYLGGRLLRPVMGLFGGAASGEAAGSSLLGAGATRFAQGAATAPLMPSLYAERAIQNNREAGRNATDWRGFPSALTLAAIQNGVFSSVSNLGGSAPTGPGALDTSRRLFAQTLGAMAVQQGMDIGTSAVDDAAREVFGTSWNLSTRYGLIGHLARGESGEAMQDAMTQAITMFAFAGLHESANRPRRPGSNLADWTMPPDRPNPPGTPSPPPFTVNSWRVNEPTKALTRYREGMDATRRFLSDMSEQRRTPEEAAAELHRTMSVVHDVVTRGQDEGMTREQARQRVIDTFPEGQTRDYGLKAVELAFPQGMIGANRPGGPYADTPHMRNLFARADAIRGSLAPAPKGTTRLWRGEKPGERTGQSTRYTDSLEGIALPFAQSGLSFVDVPTDQLNRFRNAGEPNAFNLPTTILKNARAVNHTAAQQAAPEARQGVTSSQTAPESPQAVQTPPERPPTSKLQAATDRATMRQALGDTPPTLPTVPKRPTAETSRSIHESKPADLWFHGTDDAHAEMIASDKHLGRMNHGRGSLSGYVTDDAATAARFPQRAGRQPSGKVIVLKPPLGENGERYRDQGFRESLADSPERAATVSIKGEAEQWRVLGVVPREVANQGNAAVLDYLRRESRPQSGPAGMSDTKLRELKGKGYPGVDAELARRQVEQPTLVLRPGARGVRPAEPQAAKPLGLNALQEGTLAKVRDPAKQEFLRQNFLRQNAQAKTLYDAVVNKGGISPKSIASYGLDFKMLRDSFPKALFSKGGQSLEAIVGGSEIGRQVWGDRPETAADKIHRGEDLFQKLANHYLLEPGDWYAHEMHRAGFEALKEEIHEQFGKLGLKGETLDAAVNAEARSRAEDVNRIETQAALESHDFGDAWEGPTVPRSQSQTGGRPESRTPEAAPVRTPESRAVPAEAPGTAVNRKLSDFLAEFHGDESGHVDPEVLRDFAEQYGIDPARKAIHHLNTVWRQIAGEGSPRTTDANQAAGEALERFNNADNYGRFAAPVFAQKVLAGHDSPQFRMKLGGVLTERSLRWTRKVFNEQAQAASAQLQAAISDRDAAQRAEKQATADAAEHRRNGMPQAASASEAFARNFAKEKMDANARVIEASRLSSEAVKKMNNVGTIIGQPDSPFATVQEYLAARQSPEIDNAIMLHNRFVVPVMDDAFKRSQGMDPDEPINSPMQIPGSPVNLISAKSGDKDVATVIWTKGQGTAGEEGGGTSAGRPTNAKLRKNKFSRQRTGASEGYDIDYAKMVEHSLAYQLKNAAKAEAVRAGVAAGLYKWGAPGQRVAFEGEQARWGQEFNDVKPPKGTQEALNGQTSLYVHPELAHEFRRSVEIDEPLKFKTIEKAMGALMAVNLASTAELTYHAKNQLGFLMRTGFHPAELFRDIVGVIKKDPAIMDELVEQARIGTMKSEGFEVDNIINRGKYNPLKLGGRLLDLTRKVLLLQGKRAYMRMVKAGLTKESETGLRNFQNQLGNYNRRSQHKLIKFLRDSQIGPFATAGFNYLVQGVRSVAMNPGVKPASFEAMIRLRAGMLLRTVAVLATVELINKALWGRLDASDDTPLGAVRVGTSQDGRAQYFDVMDLIGLKRGLRITGLLALIEGKRKNALPEKMIDKAGRDIVTALVHPLAGPGAQFGLTSAFGVDASGFHVAQHASQLRHESQAALNIQAALEHANPAYGTAFGHSQKQKTAAQRAMELLGPFGVKTAQPPRLR